jgi:nucleoid-associated protein YgaU
MDMASMVLTAPAVSVVSPIHRGSAVQPALRLTRRGRLVVTAGMTLAASVVATVVMLGLGSPAVEASVPATAATTHTVLAGESLWSIAGVIAGSGDMAAAVYEIKRINGLSSSELHPGQVLVLPR